MRITNECRSNRDVSTKCISVSDKTPTEWNRNTDMLLLSIDRIMLAKAGSGHERAMSAFTVSVGANLIAMLQKPITLLLVPASGTIHAVPSPVFPSHQGLLAVVFNGDISLIFICGTP